MALSPVFMQTLVTFLHDVFTAIWIGGMITLLVTVYPSMRKTLSKSKETNALNKQIKKTLSIITYISIVGLIVTGLMMGHKARLAGDYLGFFSFGTPYSALLSIKHILYILMVGLAIFRSQIIDRLKKPSPEVKMKLNMITLILNVIAGLAVLLLSANIAILASMP